MNSFSSERISTLRAGICKYGAAVLGVGAALGLYHFVSGLNAAPLALFLLVVALVAVFGGFGPAIVAAVLSVVVADWFVLPPSWSFLGAPVPLGVLFAFLATSTVLAWLADSRRMARRHADVKEARFQAAQELSPDGFCILRPLFYDETVDYEWEYANPAAERMLKRSDLVGKRLLDELPGLRAHPQVLEQGMTALRMGRSEPLEFRYDADGIQGCFRMTSVRIEDCVAVSFGDITARMETETALRRNEERLRSIIEDAPIPILVHTVEGEVIAMSRAFRRITGYDLVEIPDVEAWLRKVRGIQADKLSAAHALYCAKCATVACYAKEEQVIYTKAGEERTWIIHSSSPHRLSDGRRVLASMAVDITERKQAERALREGEALLRAYHETSIDGFLVFRAVRQDGRIVDLEYTYANPAAERITGHGPLVGRRLLEVMPSHGGSGGLFERYAQVVDTGQPHDIEFHYDGEGIRSWFRNTSVKLGDGVAMSFTDISGRKRAEEALHHSEAQLRTVVDNLAEGVVVSDLQGNLLHWNRAALQMHGLTDGDDCRCRFGELSSLFELSGLDGRVWSVEDWPLSRILRGERLEAFEVRIRRLDFDWRRIYSYGGSLVYDGDRPLMALVTIEDITERKQAEEALRHSEEKFAKAFTTNPAAIALTRLEDGLFLDVNDSWMALMGYTREEVVGRRYSRKMSIWPKEEDAARFVAELREKGFLQGWEQTFHKKSGEPFVAQLSAQMLTVRGEQVILSTFLDITGRTRAEAALRESERRYRTLFNEIDEGFCVIEVIFDDSGKAIDYRFLETNPSFERQTGLSDAVGKRVRELVPAHDEHWFVIYGQVARTGVPVRFRNRAEQLGRWYDVYSFRFGAPENRQVAVLFNDISQHMRDEEALKTFAQTLESRVAERTAELEHTYDALRQSERLATLGEAMAVLSHENRNAIQNGLAALQVLRRLVAKDEKQLRYAEAALKSLNRLHRAYEDIRQYAAPLKLEKNTVSMDALWRETWTDLAPLLLEREVYLEESWNGSGCQCELDRVRIQQVFRNLIENALDACPDPVELRVSCEDAERDGRRVLRVTVRDNGPGLSAAEAEKALNPFFTTKTKGTGLGLSIVQRIVEAHDGHIAIHTGEGQGFEAVIELPR